MKCFIFALSFVTAVMLQTGFEATILIFPRNKMAFAKESVELQCSMDSDKSLLWSVTYSGTTKSIPLFLRGNLTSAGISKYKIDTRIRGQYNLIIESVDFSHSGKYKCFEDSLETEAEVDLAVIDFHPLCTANDSGSDNSVVENDYLWMQCNLEYSGSVRLPSMIWTRTSTGNVLPDTVGHRNQSSTSNANNRIQSGVVIQVNCSDDNEVFTFNATFSQENNSREIFVTWNYAVSCTNTETTPGSPAVLIGSVVTVAVICVVVVIALLTCLRLKSNAWTSRRSEPDVLSNDLYTTHYYDIMDLSNVSPVPSTAVSRADNVAQQDPTFSDYELVREVDSGTLAGGLSPSQQVRAPAYSKVNKKGKALKAHPGNNNSIDQTSTKRPIMETNYFGDDGTQYTRVDSLPEERLPSCTSPPKPPRFRPVDNYAPIDHTQRAPPPPPRL